MILTGICKEKFLEWLKLNYPLGAETLEWSNIRALFLNALIIEFFDEQEYKIEADVYNLWNYCFVKCYWDRGFKEYKQSVVQAIKKANNIYNNTDKV